MINPGSRYARTEQATWTPPEGGDPVRYLKRRFLPQGESLPTLARVTVSDGDRLDHIAARVLGDPEVFWRICDAENGMYPPRLTAVPGRRLRVPIPG